MVVALLGSCDADENEGEKKKYTNVVGEFDAEFELTQPFQASDHVHFLIYNTADESDSLWIDEENFFESKVKVAWDGKNTFSVTEGHDVYNGETVNIEGEIFGDSVRVEWRYLQGGDPEDDYIVIAKGKRYTGLD